MFSLCIAGAPRTTPPNISDIVEREGEEEEERHGINMRYAFAALFAACSQNIIDIFAPGIGAYPATKYGLMAGIYPAGSSSIIGMNESLIAYDIALFMGAHTIHNNGSTTGLFAGQLAVLLVIVIGFFWHILAPIICARTTNNNSFIMGAAVSAIANNNCFEKKEKKDLCPLFQYLFILARNNRVSLFLFVYAASTINYLHKMQMTKHERLKNSCTASKFYFVFQCKPYVTVSIIV